MKGRKNCVLPPNPSKCLLDWGKFFKGYCNSIGEKFVLMRIIQIKNEKIIPGVLFEYVMDIVLVK